MKKPASSRWRISLLFALIGLGMWTLSSGVFANDQDQTRLLLDGLRRGGYVIFMRHAATDHTQKDTNPNDLTDCTQQRNLSVDGRAQAKTVGEAFKALQIPVGNVYSSVFCRCLDTAKIAFGKAISTPEISSIQDLPVAERDVRVKALRDLLHRAPQPNTNTVIVSHLYLFEFAAGLSVEEGEIAILKPKADGSGIDFAGRVKASGWNDVVLRHGKR